jgi:hypothetical protein
VISGQIRCSPARHPALPPKQSSDYQVEVGGEIRLAGRSRARCRAQHKQATSRQRPQIPSDQVAQAAPDPVSNHGGADPAANDEANPGGIRLLGAHEQLTGYQWPSRLAAAVLRRLEVGLAAHPRC